MVWDISFHGVHDTMRRSAGDENNYTTVIAPVIVITVVMLGVIFLEISLAAKLLTKRYVRIFIR